MADPLRHRQTKGAATDMVDLTPPRHIPTLPSADPRSGSQVLDLIHYGRCVDNGLSHGELLRRKITCGAATAELRFDPAKSARSVPPRRRMTALLPLYRQRVRLTDCRNPPKGRPCPEIAGNRANIG